MGDREQLQKFWVGFPSGSCGSGRVWKCEERLEGKCSCSFFLPQQRPDRKILYIDRTDGRDGKPETLQGEMVQSHWGIESLKGSGWQNVFKTASVSYGLYSGFLPLNLLHERYYWKCKDLYFMFQQSRTKGQETDEKGDSGLFNIVNPLQGPQLSKILSPLQPFHSAP